MKKLFFITLLISSSTAQAQLKKPDDHFRKMIGMADSLTDRELMGSLNAASAKRNAFAAVDIYTALSKKYDHIDVQTFFSLSIQAEHPEGFYASSKLMMLSSGDSLDNLIDYYGIEDVSVFNKEPLLSAVKKIRKEEASIIRQARTSLSWKWNIELASLFKSNVDLRTIIDRELFKDSASHAEALILIDSTHLFQFCTLIEKYGYPYNSNVGYRANGANVLLRHCVFLVSVRGDRKSSAPFIEKWKFLMPYVLNGVKNGEIDAGFYQYLYGWLTQCLKDNSFTEDIAYFKQFEYKP